MLVVYVALAVMAGAIAQRVSGMGFALVVAPVLIVLIGPFDGVLMVNLCGAVSSCLVITRVWRHIDWRQYLLLVVPALLAIIPGTVVSVLLGGPALQMVVGVILLVALTVSLLVTRSERIMPRGPTGIFSGATAGFMSATAGTGGPGVSIYSVLTRWEHRQFAATIQPFFVTLGTVSFTSKVIASEGGLPEYDWWLWGLVIACTVIGLVLGECLTRVVSARIARLVVIGVSYLGGAVTVIDGALALADLSNRAVASGM